jgi:hypothetical protein
MYKILEQNGGKTFHNEEMEGKNANGEMIQLLGTHEQKEICNTQFKPCPDLRRPMHIQQHPKRYRCPVWADYDCPDSFTTSGHAIRHIKTHTRERPYICKVCNHGFARRDNMKQHLRTHDKNERGARIHTQRSQRHRPKDRISTLESQHRAMESRHSTTQHVAEYSRD